MAGTVDSGNETLFSDDSPCDSTSSPTVRGPDRATAPPRIQPFSGVLEKVPIAASASARTTVINNHLLQGKAVIRPIAFKPAARFGISGERYGSTPALARPGSRPLHYGSKYLFDVTPDSCFCQLKQISLFLVNFITGSGDLRLSGHRSLDRRHLPPAPVPLSSLPLRQTGYDSTDSVRKSPGAESGG